MLTKSAANRTPLESGWELGLCAGSCVRSAQQDAPWITALRSAWHGGADVSSALSFEHTKRLIHEAASACTAASQHDVGI